MNRKDALMLVGEMCKRHRENSGVTQAQVAEDTGYSEQNISSFETGRTNNMLIFLYYVNRGVLDTGLNRCRIKHILGGLRHGD